MGCSSSQEARSEDEPQIYSPSAAHNVPERRHFSKSSSSLGLLSNDEEGGKEEDQEMVLDGEWSKKAKKSGRENERQSSSEGVGVEQVKPSLASTADEIALRSMLNSLKCHENGVQDIEKREDEEGEGEQSTSDHQDVVIERSVTKSIVTPMSDDQKEHHRRSKVKRIRDELVQSEQSYVNNMTTAMEQLMFPIMRRNIIPVETSSDQFNDFMAIQVFNKALLDEFRARPTQVIAVLREFIPGMSVYTSYLQHFERRMHIRAKIVHDNNALHTLYHEASENCPHFLGMESYLIEPVQRIPRYRLLLSELISISQPKDDEYSIIAPTLEEISNIALLNNEAIREMEKRMEQNAIMMKVVSLTRINVLDSPDRVLLKSSFNLKCSCAGRSMQPLQIWLFNDKIIYGRKNLNSKIRSNIFRGLKYTEVSLSACNAVSSTEDDDDDNESNSFVLETELESFLITTRSSKEKLEWLNDICQAIEERRHVSSRRYDGTVVMAPVWKLNDASNVCDICSKRFGLRSRRHHCRQCGALICVTCSPHRVSFHHSSPYAVGSRKALQSSTNKKERVCNLCYNNLSYQYVQGDKFLNDQRIEITLLSATGLPNMDIISLSDPYVVFSCNNHSLKSRTIDDDLNPKWGPKDTFCFGYRPKFADYAGAREIRIDVFDEDTAFDDYIGGTIIDLDNYPLLDEGKTQLLDLPLEPQGHGRIQLELRVLMAD